MSTSNSASDYRLAVTNRNVAGSLGQVLSVLADDNVNVIDMSQQEPRERRLQPESISSSRRRRR